MCPVCGGDALSLDIEHHGSCSKCAFNNEGSPLNTLKGLLAKDEESFVAFFEKTTGMKPWGAQKHWIRRLLRGENTILIAPTGIGKSTLLIVYAIYLARKGKRVIYVVPTKPLVHQVCKRIESYANNASLEIASAVVCYDSSYSKSRREALLDRIRSRDFKILVVTGNFVHKKINLLMGNDIDVLIVDDVDSLIKNEGGVYNLVKLAGLSDRSVELAKKRLNILWKILANRAYGRNVDELIKEFIRVDKELEAERALRRKCQLVVASATGRTRGIAGKLLRELFNVDPSGITIYGRNVTDSYALVSSTKELVDLVLGLVKTLGKGGIVYVSPQHPLKSVYEDTLLNLRREFENLGFKVAIASPETVARFAEGAIDIIAGYSTYYGISVRGIDAPEQAKYVVFLGTPVIAISIEKLLARPTMLLRVLDEISIKLGETTLKNLAREIRRKLSTLSPSEVKLIKLCLIGKIPEDSIENLQKLAAVYRELKSAYLLTLKAAKEELDRKNVMTIGTITLIRAGDRYLALIPDVMTYIQATGRTSRLIGNKMTHGLSLILDFSGLENLIHGLEQRLRAFNSGIAFKHLNEVSLEKEATLIQSSRELGNQRGHELKYRSVLIVTESPTKAKAIARFFGRPSTRRVGEISTYTIPVKIGDEIVEFNLVATRGHIYDLTVDNGVGLYGILLAPTTFMPVYSSIKKCRICGTQFVDYGKCPKCGSLFYFDSKQVVFVLQKLASEVNEVHIATDPDLEGEKIAYDVYMALKPFNKNIWRIELHEITPQELFKAIREKRDIDRKLVEAEMYRRILDRLIGFSLSQRLQEKYCHKNLGAGRVQTPVLGLIIERYKEYLTNKCKKVIITINEPAKLKFSFYVEKQDEKIVENIRSARELTLVKLLERVIEVNPPPPYTTDEFLAEASRHGISIGIAMRVAQDLFESGLITYHRTDCHYVSSVGIRVASEYLSSRGLLNYFKPSHWGTPGTHEAIRPVYPLDPNDLVKAVEEGILPVVIPLTPLHIKVYDMIFRRFISSQMKPFKAIVSKFAITLDGYNSAEIDVITGIIENGFNLVKPVKVVDTLRTCDKVTVRAFNVEVLNSSKAPLYTAGDVVLLMKELSIGRPSTYSKILESIRRHGYIIESKVRRKLIPTKWGINVYTTLSRNYRDLVSIETTRRMEETIDKISRGEISGYEAVLNTLTVLMDFKLVRPELILPLNSNGDVGLYSSLNNVTSN